MLVGFILPIILAATITTGDSYSKSTVTNEVNGGSVYTKIEVEVNGEKKVLESNEPGEHSLELKSEGSSSQVESSSSSEIEKEDLLEEELEKTEKEIAEEKNFWQKIMDFITGFFKRF